jgi:hypothetical protein
MKEKAIQYLIILLIGTLGGFISSWVIFKDPSFLPIQVISKQDKVYIEENSALTSGIKETRDSIAGIQSVSLNGGSINGSGFVLTNDGMMITFADNVPLGYKSNISIKGENNISYQVLKRDLSSNLALIKVDKGNLYTRSFFENQVDLGSRVFIVSQSFDYSLNQFSYFVNEGIVKSINGEKIVTNIFETSRIEGGTAFDIQGRAIGMAYKNENNIVEIIPISKIKEFAGI